MKKSAVYFDKNCRLCRATVGFIKIHGGTDKFEFIPLQESEPGILREIHGQSKSRPDSVILRQASTGRYYFKSTAVLKILKELGGLWSSLYVFIIIPGVLRDRIYEFIARNRYRWFGQIKESEKESDRIETTRGTE